MIFPEHYSIHFANLTANVDVIRGQGSEILKTAGRLLWRDEGCSSRVCREGNYIFAHALETLSNWRDVDNRLFTADGGAIPESAFKFRPIRKGQLGQEKSQNDENFTKGNRSGS